ncbi:MAG: D-inositol-3-phosphate glycosyltransferase [Pseudonocardiales bacterium]|nr:D-inositol-3-phosphate glycosyltransferase [Pseudonocardiales bacterium]
MRATAGFVPEHARIRPLRRVVSALASSVGATTVGSIDAAARRRQTDSDVLILEGWLDATRCRPAPRVLIVQADGEQFACVSVDALGPLWPTTSPGMTPWRIELPADGLRSHARVEVLAVTARAATSLGVRLVAPTPADPVTDRLPMTAAGSLDEPRPESVIEMPACRISGWVLVGGSAADHIEVFVDDAPARRLRRGLPRTDVGVGAASYTCGFDDIIPLPPRPDGTPIVIRVRAVGVDGSTWHAEPVTVTMRPREPASDAPAAITMPPLSAEVGRRLDRTRPGEPLRVAVFTHSLRIGGGELYLQQLLLRLAAVRGIELLVVSPQDGALRTELEAAGISVHVTHGYPVDSAHYAGAQVELRSLAERWGADAALANTLGTFPAVDAMTAAGIPVVWAIHESFELSVFEHLNWGSKGLDPAVSTRMRAALSAADVVVFEASSTLDLYSRDVPDMRARLVPYGVVSSNIAAYIDATSRPELRAATGSADDDIVFLCVGVFEPRKAVLALVAAFGEVASRYPQARLVLVGGHRSPYADAVRDAITSLDLSERVDVVEINPDVYRWYRIADFIVSASDVESLPRSLLEAMTFAVPVIAAKSFGTVDLVVDADNGFLCNANSHVALVAALLRALRLSPAQRAEMGRRSSQRVTELGGQDYHEDYGALLAKAAAENRIRNA